MQLDGENGTNSELQQLLNKFPYRQGGTENVPAGTERNEYRASFAARALLAYADFTGELDEPLETTISDLLADLLHLTDLMPVECDLFVLLANGKRHHDEEKAGE